MKMLNLDAVMAKLRGLADPEAAKGMARFGFNPDNTLGISIPDLRSLAREIDKDHKDAPLGALNRNSRLPRADNSEG